MGAFRDDWQDVQRQIIHKSGRKRLCLLWFEAVLQVETVAFEDLLDPGSTFESYDSKIFEAGLKASPQFLQRGIRRIDAELNRRGH